MPVMLLPLQALGCSRESVPFTREHPGASRKEIPWHCNPGSQAHSQLYLTSLSAQTSTS